MTIHDSHCHSIYSGDVDKTRGASIDGMYARACELGLGSLAVTDHLEIDQLMGNVYPPLDNEGIRRDITAAREKYAGKIEYKVIKNNYMQLSVPMDCYDSLIIFE